MLISDQRGKHTSIISMTDQRINISEIMKIRVKKITINVPLQDLAANYAKYIFSISQNMYLKLVVKITTRVDGEIVQYGTRTTSRLR